VVREAPNPSQPFMPSNTSLKYSAEINFIAQQRHRDHSNSTVPASIPQMDHSYWSNIEWAHTDQRWANPNRDSIWIAIFGTLGFDSSILGFDLAAHDWDLIRFVTFAIRFGPNAIRAEIAVALRHHVIRHVICTAVSQWPQ